MHDKKAEKQDFMRKGFTLVELSIVLVIVGLLIGGILVGQSLMDSAKINAQIRQVQQFDIAITNFKAKFKQIPGDCNICNHAASSYAEGDNDGWLEDSFGNRPSSGYYPELGAFFIDLHRMGMIKDRYANVVSVGLSVGKDKELPSAGIGRGGLVVVGTSTRKIVYSFTSIMTNTTSVNYPYMLGTGNFSPNEALSLDSKLDDGFPGTGDVRAVSVSTTVQGDVPFPLNTTNGTCINTGTPNVYNTSLSATDLCQLTIKSDYKD